MNIQIEELKPLLAEISNKVGEGSEFAWEAIYRQQYVEGFMGLFSILSGLILGYLSYKLFINSKRKEYNSNSEMFYLVSSITIGIIAVTTIMLGFPIAINHLANPEYQAIVDLFKLLN